MQKITIIGAGLAGCMFAIYLAQRGYAITMIEKREDIRNLPQDFGRSINLALSKRGMVSLNQVGCLDEVLHQAVAMRARAIHDTAGNITYQPFGRHNEESIFSIKRSDLSRTLLSEIENYANIEVRFLSQINQIDFDNKQLFVSDKIRMSDYSLPYDILIGADGAGSIVREMMTQKGYVSSERKWMHHGYKELTISADFGQKIHKNCLHLWPRQSFMLLGNPNNDNSITATLFLNKKGNQSFETLQSSQQIKQFFYDYFPDIYDHLPNLVQEFKTNPIGHISSIECTPWSYNDCLLIGDAAHGIVPFFGQGMNCAFEDCRVFIECLNQTNDNWTQAMSSFYQARKANTDAIAKMSMDNYKEIESDICNASFNSKKTLENAIMKKYEKEYASKHIMVMFSTQPYALIEELGSIQSQMLDEIHAQFQKSQHLDWQFIEQKLADYDNIMTKLKSKY